LLKNLVNFLWKLSALSLGKKLTFSLELVHSFSDYSLRATDDFDAIAVTGSEPFAESM
jgi:hypothetical protein